MNNVNLKQEIITGQFIEECKNRFYGKVKTEDKIIDCYISSSSKLSRFIELVGRDVLLIKNKKNLSKTEYTLHAVKSTDGYILLNLGIINKLLLDELTKSTSIYSGTIYCEKKITDFYRADFLINGSSNFVIEAKGIITEKSTAYLPSMKVDRAVSQLNALRDLLKKGYLVHYYIVLMSSSIKCLYLEKSYNDFFQLFQECLSLGMEIFTYRAVWRNHQVSVIKDSAIELILS